MIALLIKDHLRSFLPNNQVKILFVNSSVIFFKAFLALLFLLNKMFNDFHLQHEFTRLGKSSRPQLQSISEERLEDSMKLNYNY